MLEKIPLNRIYVATKLVDNVELIYSNVLHTTTVVHKFRRKTKRYSFLILFDEINNFSGYLNLKDKKRYDEKFIDENDYELMFKDCDETAISLASKSNSGFVGFEPLSNYTSKFIKPVMTIKQIEKAIKDINKQLNKNYLAERKKLVLKK